MSLPVALCLLVLSVFCAILKMTCIRQTVVMHLAVFLAPPAVIAPSLRRYVKVKEKKL